MNSRAFLFIQTSLVKTSWSGLQRKLWELKAIITYYNSSDTSLEDHDTSRPLSLRHLEKNVEELSSAQFFTAFARGTTVDCPVSSAIAVSPFRSSKLLFRIQMVMINISVHHPSNNWSDCTPQRQICINFPWLCLFPMPLKMGLPGTGGNDVSRVHFHNCFIEGRNGCDNR